MRKVLTHARPSFVDLINADADIHLAAAITHRRDIVIHCVHDLQNIIAARHRTHTGCCDDVLTPCDVGSVLQQFKVIVAELVVIER